jgi:hypothetical protein
MLISHYPSPQQASLKDDFSNIEQIHSKICTDGFIIASAVKLITECFKRDPHSLKMFHWKHVRNQDVVVTQLC